MEDLLHLVPSACSELYLALHEEAERVPDTRSFVLEHAGKVTLRILEPQHGKVYVRSDVDNPRGGIVSGEGKLIVMFELLCAVERPVNFQFSAYWQVNEHLHEMDVASSCSSSDNRKFNYLSMPSAWSLLRKGQNTFGLWLWLEVDGKELILEEVVDFFVYFCPQRKRECREH
eukprot:621674-Hanusia_phi.AAC.1